MIDDFTPRPSGQREAMQTPKPTVPTSVSTATDNSKPVLPPPAVLPVQPAEGSIVSGSNNGAQHQASVDLGTGRVRRFHFGNPFSWPPTKRQLLITIPVILLIIGGGAGAWALTHQIKPVTTAKAKTVKKAAAPAPKVIVSKLTGLPVADDSVNQRPVTGVMIENSPDARPQSGLDQAGVVFEAIAEGGITRFLALFQDSQPDYIGPVRSARPYYLQWCQGFDCSIAHVGGSPEALQNIKDWGVKDLDQFANSGAYHRIPSRYAPHNVYTSIGELNQLETSKGYGASTYDGFARKADNVYKAPAASTATTKTPAKQDTRTVANKIDMSISGYYYNTHYDFDVATNSYARSEGGAAHEELNKDGSRTGIKPKVVVAMVMPYGLEADDHHSFYTVTGSGRAFIFQDGTITTGTWNKFDAKGQIIFKDDAGKPISLNAGQTWLTALSADNQVSYQ